MHLCGEKWELVDGRIVTIVGQKGQHIRVITQQGRMEMITESYLKTRVDLPI